MHNVINAILHTTCVIILLINYSLLKMNIFTARVIKAIFETFACRKELRLYFLFAADFYIFSAKIKNYLSPVRIAVFGAAIQRSPHCCGDPPFDSE